MHNSSMIIPYFKNIRQEITNELQSAQTEIKVAVCWFTCNELFDILCEKLNEKVSVSLIVLNDAINNKPDGLIFQKFIDLGGIFYFSDVETPMHNKYCIIDKSILINGSYNWTYFAENKNHENITIVKDEQIASIYLSDFDRLTKACKFITNVKNEANTVSGKATIVENVIIASDQDLIIKTKKDFTGSQLSSLDAIGLSIHEDKFYEFIPKLSNLPVEKTHILTTLHDNQANCINDIRHGINIIASLNEQIGTFHVTGIPPMEKGKPGLITTFSIDTYGILTVTVKIRETGRFTIHKFNIEHLIYDTLQE